MNSMHYLSLATEIGVHGADMTIHFSYTLPYGTEPPLFLPADASNYIQYNCIYIRYEVQRHNLAYSRQNQGHVSDTAHLMYMLIL